MKNGDGSEGKGGRSSLPPLQLRAITDRIAQEPNAVWRLAGVDPRNAPFNSADIRLIAIWVNILDDADDLERMQAPRLGAYLRFGGSTSVAVASLGIAFMGPIAGGLVAGAALATSGLSGMFAIFDGKALIQKDMRCNARLRAIEEAKLALKGALNRNS